MKEIIVKLGKLFFCWMFFVATYSIFFLWTRGILGQIVAISVFGIPCLSFHLFESEGLDDSFYVINCDKFCLTVILYRSLRKLLERLLRSLFINSFILRCGIGFAFAFSNSWTSSPISWWSLFPLWLYQRDITRSSASTVVTVLPDFMKWEALLFIPHHMHHRLFGFQRLWSQLNWIGPMALFILWIVIPQEKVLALLSSCCSSRLDLVCVLTCTL